MVDAESGASSEPSSGLDLLRQPAVPDAISEAALSWRKRLRETITAWRGSGDATVALAPWLRAHDEEMQEVVEPPAECGLAIAVKLAREYVRAETGRTRDAPATGQADLGAWSP